MAYAHQTFISGDILTADSLTNIDAGIMDLQTNLTSTDENVSSNADKINNLENNLTSIN